MLFQHPQLQSPPSISVCSPRLCCIDFCIQVPSCLSCASLYHHMHVLYSCLCVSLCIHAACCEGWTESRRTDMPPLHHLETVSMLKGKKKRSAFVWTPPSPHTFFQINDSPRGTKKVIRVNQWRLIKELFKMTVVTWDWLITQKVRRKREGSVKQHKPRILCRKHLSWQQRCWKIIVVGVLKRWCAPLMTSMLLYVYLCWMQDT